MPLTAGKRLGPYEIETPLGAGGMGEVYRARDTRLDRTVAVKVLPEHLSQNPDVRARFEREARAASSLSHSHICTVHDVGHQDGIDFLVMEYLEGETMAVRLEQGPLPLDDVLRYATQVADALDRAHQSGLIHRDLKPGNIMITAAGAKVLDFGLAKVLGPVGSSDSLTAAPTATSPLTAEGAILGTFQYMAPEQLEGKEADARSDIFAFGSVVYEMTTGRKAFAGPTQAGLIASILKEEPQPVSTVLPALPPGLDRLLQNCLAKDPDKRRQSMRDVLVDLRWVAEGSAVGDEPAVHSGMSSRERWLWVALVALLVMAVGFLVTRLPGAAPPQAVVRATLLPPENVAFETGSPVTLSHDGRRLVFLGLGEAGAPSLWVRELATGKTEELPGTRGANYPFWSPDDRWLAFLANGKLNKISVAGGPPIVLCDANTGRGGTWGPDGTILFQPDFSEPLHRVPSGGGRPESITELNEEQFHLAHRWPYFLPDGRHFLFYVVSTTNPIASEHSGVYLGSLDSPEIRQLLQVESRAAYANGHLVFRRGTSLMAQPFDLGSLELAGDQQPIASDIRGGVFSWGGANFGVSDDGALVFLTGGTQGETELVWFDRQGERLGQLGAADNYWNPRISPDGRAVSLGIGGDVGDIWLHDIQRDVRQRFSFNPEDEGNAVWSPDGTRLAYYATHESTWQVFQRAIDDAGKDQVLLESNTTILLTDWSPDGRFLVYTSLDRKTGWDIWLYSFDDGKSRPLLQQPYTEIDGRISPDGRWMAFTSDETGQREIYVQAFPEPGRRWIVSTDGGNSASWSRDGKELFFLSTGGLMVADVSGADASFESRPPRHLFPVSTKGSLGTGYDVHPDGQRILVNQTVTAEGTSVGATLILNWPGALHR
jgi:Tol biopolymer transport system component